MTATSQTLTLTEEDPEVARVLSSMAQVRHERDSLKLDVDQTKRNLADADVKIRHLEQQLQVAQTQRDQFMARLVEVNTYLAGIRTAFEAADRAANAVVDAAKVSHNGNGKLEGRPMMPKATRWGDIAEDTPHGAIGG